MPNTRSALLICIGLVVAWIVENGLFGADDPGTKHDISVVFFLLGVVGVLGLLALGAVALTQRMRSGDAR